MVFIFSYITWMAIFLCSEAELDESCHPVVSDRFLCKDNNIEMDVMWTCDDVLDCNEPNDEDADVCTTINCPRDYFRCPGSRCIRDIKLCDMIDDCPRVNGSYVADEDPDKCPDPCTPTPCLNGGTCTRITYFEYECLCPEGLEGDNCTAPNVTEGGGGPDAVTIGVISAVGGVTAANTGCMIYTWYKDVKKKADALKKKAAKLKKKAKKAKEYSTKKANKEETKSLLATNDVESQKPAKVSPKGTQPANDVNKPPV